MQSLFLLPFLNQNRNVSKHLSRLQTLAILSRLFIVLNPLSHFLIVLTPVSHFLIIPTPVSHFLVALTHLSHFIILLKHCLISSSC